MNDDLLLKDFRFASRLILGTGKFSGTDTMVKAIEESGAQLVTVALRRFNKERRSDDLYGPLSQLKHVTVVPNTSGARNAGEAVRAALLGREISRSSFVKVEIHPNPHHLMPDPIETLEAAQALVKEGFVVLPYTNDDLVVALRLIDAGASAIMPLGAPIGSGMGIQNIPAIRILRERITEVPLIVDAGVGTASDAALAMELGADGVLMNSAIAGSADPGAMAEAMNYAVKAGRLAFKAGRIPRKLYASASSPLDGLIR